MPALTNPKHELFSQLVASGVTKSEAARQVGFSEKRANQAGSETYRRKEVKARVTEIRNRVAEVTITASAVTKSWVIDTLIKNIEEARQDKQYTAVKSSAELIGIELGMFQKIEHQVGWDGDPSSLTDKQRVTVMRWLAQMAYPDDPEKVEAALSGTEVIDTVAQIEAPSASTRQEEVQMQEDTQSSDNSGQLNEERIERVLLDPRPHEINELILTEEMSREDAAEMYTGLRLPEIKSIESGGMNERAPWEEVQEEASAEHGSGAGDERAGGEAVHGDDISLAEQPIRVTHSWAYLEEEERTRLAEEWRAKGPALPEGLNLEEMVAWLDINWPLDGDGW